MPCGLNSILRAARDRRHSVASRNDVCEVFRPNRAVLFMGLVAWTLATGNKIAYNVPCSRRCTLAEDRTTVQKFTNRKLSHRRGTARRTVSVEILSTSAEMYRREAQLPQRNSAMRYVSKFVLCFTYGS